MGVSFKADKQDIRVIQFMADERNMTIGRFLREAFMQVHGEEFNAVYKRLFFAEGGSQKNEMDRDRPQKKEKR